MVAKQEGKKLQFSEQTKGEKKGQESQWSGRMYHLGGDRAERVAIMRAGVRIETLLCVGSECWVRAGGQQQGQEKKAAQEERATKKRYEGLVRLCREEKLLKRERGG